MCVVFGESCVSCSARPVLALPARRKNSDGGARNKRGRGGRRDLFGKSCMVV